jgi:hypothetical protein
LPAAAAVTRGACRFRARPAACARRASAGARPRPRRAPSTSGSTTCCPRCRIGSGCCRFAPRCRCAWATTRMPSRSCVAASRATSAGSCADAGPYVHLHLLVAVGRRRLSTSPTPSSSAEPQATLRSSAATTESRI